MAEKKIYRQYVVVYLTGGMIPVGDLKRGGEYEPMKGAAVVRASSLASAKAYVKKHGHKVTRAFLA